MSWRTMSPMSERTKFVVLHESGDRTMAGLCQEFGISRKTGYKWLKRYEERGLEGLKERNRAPLHHPNETDPRIVGELLKTRKAHPTWGPKKLLWTMERQGIAKALPSTSTAWAILKRNGLVEPKHRRRRLEAGSNPGWEASGPNDVWCADFKGQFKTLDGEYCYPLTVTDGYSRFLVSCQGLPSTRVDGALKVFERAFREYGLPGRLRTDNGAPFASTGLARLTQLSVWFYKLGIELERIQPGHPEQNGRHERMHRTLKKETVFPPGKDRREQQRKFDRFRGEFNDERPHEALGLRPPATLYRPSNRSYPRKFEEYDYPGNYEVRKVTDGKIAFRMHNIYTNECLSGERVGLVETDNGIWRVYFRGLELGVIDERLLKRSRRLGYGKVLPMCPI